MFSCENESMKLVIRDVLLLSQCVVLSLPPPDHGFNNHKIESVQWMMSAEAIRGRKAPPRAPLSITPTTIIQLGSFQVSSLILDGMTNQKAE